MKSSQDLKQVQTMQVVQGKSFQGRRAWDRLPIAVLDGTSVNLHWTDQPYIWHVNDGQEVFVVLDGQVDMHVRSDGKQEVIAMQEGDIFYAGVGTEHVAHPRGVARILVIEKEGSV